MPDHSKSCAHLRRRSLGLCSCQCSCSSVCRAAHRPLSLHLCHALGRDMCITRSNSFAPAQAVLVLVQLPVQLLVCLPSSPQAPVAAQAALQVAPLPCECGSFFLCSCLGCTPPCFVRCTHCTCTPGIACASSCKRIITSSSPALQAAPLPCKAAACSAVAALRVHPCTLCLLHTPRLRTKAVGSTQADDSTLQASYSASRRLSPARQILTRPGTCRSEL